MMSLAVRLFCCLGTSLVLASANAGYYDTSYVQSECSPNKTITPGQNGWNLYGYLAATQSDCYEHNKDCSVTLMAKPNHHVTMRFEWMSITCPDYLNITGQTDSNPYCGYSDPAYSIYSSSNWVNLRFVTDSSSCAAGFRLYYTSYHYGECSANEFRCSVEGRCIPNELRCDQNDNCGDWSDEWAGTCGLTTAAVVAISVSCALMGIALIAFLFYCIYDRKHRSTSTRSSTSGSSSSSRSSAAAAVDRRRSNPARNTTEPLEFVEPIGPPKYIDVPPAYTSTTTTSAGLYEDPDQIHPPPYHHSTFTTAPYTTTNNNNSNKSTCNNDNARRLNDHEDNSSNSNSNRADRDNKSS